MSKPTEQPKVAPLDELDRALATLARVRGLLKYPEVTKVMLVEALGEFGPTVVERKS